MEKEHKRQEEEMMERERAALKETLEKISEEEEKECKEKDEKKRCSYELSHLSEEFRKEQGSFAEEPSVTKAFISRYNRTSAKKPKGPHYYTEGKRLMTKTKKKIAKRGPRKVAIAGSDSIATNGQTGGDCGGSKLQATSERYKEKGRFNQGRMPEAFQDYRGPDERTINGIEVNTEDTG